MAKGNNTDSSKPAQVTVVLRLIAGAYLVYLAYGLFQDYLKPVGGGRLIQIGAAVLFFGFGGVIAGWSVLRFVKGDYIKYGQIPDDEEEQEAAESEEEGAGPEEDESN